MVLNIIGKNTMRMLILRFCYKFVLFLFDFELGFKLGIVTLDLLEFPLDVMEQDSVKGNADSSSASFFILESFRIDSTL